MAPRFREPYACKFVCPSSLFYLLKGFWVTASRDFTPALCSWIGCWLPSPWDQGCRQSTLGPRRGQYQPNAGFQLTYFLLILCEHAHLSYCTNLLCNMHYSRDTFWFVLLLCCLDFSFWHYAPVEVSTHFCPFQFVLLQIIVFVIRTDPVSIFLQIGSEGRWCF